MEKKFLQEYWYRKNKVKPTAQEAGTKDNLKLVFMGSAEGNRK